MLLFHPRGTAMACDKCGKELDQGGRRVFATAYAAVETAKNLGWKSCKASPYKDTCPECRRKVA